MSALENLRRKNAGLVQPTLPLAPTATPTEAAAIEAAFKAEDAAMGAPLLSRADLAPAVDPFAPEDVAPLAIAYALPEPDANPVNLAEFMPERPKVGIAAKSTLVDLTVHFWTATKLDPKVTRATALAHGANAGKAGRYIKNLFDPSWLKDPQTAANKVRTYVDSVTIPWSRGGVRLLPTAKLAEFKTETRRLIAEFDRSVVILLSRLAEMYDAAKVDLGSMWEATDYPGIDEVRRKYGINIDYYPVPDGSHFILDLEGEEVDRLVDSVTEMANRAVEMIRADLVKKVRGPVEKMAERLKAYERGADGKVKATFRDSLVENVAEVVAEVPVYNVAGDEDIAAILVDVERDLTRHAPDVLRNDDRARAETAAKADAILAKMSQLFGAPDAG